MSDKTCMNIDCFACFVFPNTKLEARRKTHLNVPFLSPIVPKLPGGQNF